MYINMESVQKSIRDVDDPLEALIKIDQEIRPIADNSDEYYPPAYDTRTYFNVLSHAAELLGIDLGIPQPMKETWPPEYAQAVFDDIRTSLEKKKLEFVIASRQMDGVKLDSGWRTKIHSYCAHIREIVEKAQLDTSLRQSIMNRISDLEREVDRQRTRLQAFGAVLVELCTGLGSGAKELEPAIRAVERVTAAVGQIEKNPPPVMLPAPENFGLDDVDHE